MSALSQNSSSLTASNLKTFIGAKEFEVSRDFYVALGWRLNFEEGDLAELELNGCRFYLQRYYQKHWCNNSMMYMNVEDATAWHAHIQQVLSKKSFGASRTKEPTKQDFAKLVTHMWDPSGILWHLAQLK